MSSLRTNEEWISIIQGCRNSGLSDHDWLQEHGISQSAFYYNIRKLRKLACEIPGLQKPTRSLRQEIVPLQIIDDDGQVYTKDPQDTQTLPMPLSWHTPGVFTIEADGVTVRCPDGISAAAISSVIHALRLPC